VDRRAGITLPVPNAERQPGEGWLPGSWLWSEVAPDSVG
jgi:hypothetical protein